jgi:hypothetical protein
LKINLKGTDIGVPMQAPYIMDKYRGWILQSTYLLQAPHLVPVRVVTLSVSMAALQFLYKAGGDPSLNILLSDPQVNHRGSVPHQSAEEEVPQTLLFLLLVLEVVQGSFIYGQGTTIKKN